MAGPVDSFAQLPDDSGNTGKKIRSQTKTVGANTVHEHFFVQSRQAVLLGVYRAAMAQVVALNAAQNGTTTGALWFINPTATVNKKLRLRRVLVSTQHSTVLATPTAPRLRLDRITFTGTSSGAVVTPGKVDSAFGSPVAVLTTVVTGITVSLVAAMGIAPFCGALTAVGAYAPGMIDMFPTSAEDEWNVFAPGEGCVIWQDTAGTSADTREANIVLIWDEIDTA